jgi:MEDS: MEthanogen/methylotroph, DcmR Sensory domain
MGQMRNSSRRSCRSCARALLLVTAWWFAVAPQRATCSEGELGCDGTTVYLDYATTYSTPIGAVAAYQELVDGYLSHGADRVRVVAEAVYDRTADERVEGRYEAVANKAMARYPVSAICLYDTRLVPTDLLAFGKVAHPALITDSKHQDNPDYVQPAEFLRRTNKSTPDPVEATGPRSRDHEGRRPR